MAISIARRSLLAVFAVLLSACTGGSSVPSGRADANVPSIALPRIARVVRAMRPSLSVSPNAFPHNTWVYTAQLYGNDAKVYQHDGSALTLVETLTSGLSAPQGTVATINGWWYVANGGHANVLIYRSTNRGPTGPLGTLDDFGQIPANVDVTPSRRLVAVSNVATASGGSGSVSIYVNRNAEPSRTLTFGKRPLQGIGIAIDRRGDCYWSFNDLSTGSGSIVDFTGCDGRGKIVVSGIVFAGGLAFDQHDDLYYVDQTAGIYTCQKTTKCRLFSTGFGDPVNVNFDLKQKHLWVADATGFVDAVNPKTGAIVFSTPVGGGPDDAPFGIAPAPGS
jgi:DNA-binding beta-propeller fold protein YncE